MTIPGDATVRDEIRALIGALDAAVPMDGRRGFLTTRYAIGGTHWRVHTGTGGGAASMLDACAALKVRAVEPARTPPPGLDLYVWDDAQDHVAPASLGALVGRDAQAAAARAPGASPASAPADLSGYSDATSHSFWMPAAGVLSAIDFERRRAHWWLRDVARAPYYERAAPFRHILQWWASAQGGALLHASAICTTPAEQATPRGVLIVGPSGSGKSTTALACLAAGLRVTSDDYVLVDAATPPRAHLAYTTAKIVREDVGRHQAYARHMLNLDRHAEKPMMFVDRFAPDSICTSFVIDALVMPRVAHAARTRIQPMSGAAMLRALAPSSMLLFPLAGARTLHRMGELCAQLPCFCAELADDSRDVAQAIAGFAPESRGRPGAAAVS